MVNVVVDGRAVVEGDAALDACMLTARLSIPVSGTPFPTKNSIAQECSRLFATSSVHQSFMNDIARS